MGLLENAISEELPSHQVQRPHAALADAPDGVRPRKAQAKAQEKNKVIAAAVGATLTALTSKFELHRVRRSVAEMERVLSARVCQREMQRISERAQRVKGTMQMQTVGLLLGHT